MLLRAFSRFTAGPPWLSDVSIKRRSLQQRDPDRAITHQSGGLTLRRFFRLRKKHFSASADEAFHSRFVSSARPRATLTHGQKFLAAVPGRFLPPMDERLIDPLSSRLLDILLT